MDRLEEPRSSCAERTLLQANSHMARGTVIAAPYTPGRIESKAARATSRGMTYLLAIAVPPLALLLQGRPLQAVFNGLLWLGSLLFILLPFVAGQAGWLLAVIWAIAVTYNRRQDVRDRRLIAEAMRGQVR